jgi:RNA polymerase sigma-70 factor (ECF subfamily)
MSQEDALKGEGDRFLIDAVRSGDPGAFRQLVDRFSGRLRAYAARRLSGTSIEPEDAVQETFLGLLQRIERLGEVRSLEAYLFRILLNKISDLVHGRPEAHGMRRVPLACDDADSSRRGYEPVARVGTPSAYARREESVESRGQVLADILEEVIGALREERNFRDLKVLELMFFSSWKNRDIASAVGVSEPTVTRIKQATIERLARLASRHPRGPQCRDFLEEEEQASDLIRTTWAENLLSCLKRSTLGAHSLGVLEKEWSDYVVFHIETAGCETCAANLADLQSEDSPEAERVKERVFQSSVGFLRKR